MIEQIVLKPIGIVRSIFKTPKEAQTRSIDTEATVEILEGYRWGLKDLDEFSHIILVFYFHLSKGFSLITKPPHNNPDNKTYGIFATHSPFRPNGIGVSVVKLKGIKDNIVYIENKDIADASPILDIKPYIPEKINNVKIGWYK